MAQAKTAWNARQYSQVQTLLTKAVRLDPNKPRAYSGLAELELYYLNDPNSAAQHALAAISRGGEVPFHLRHDRSGDTFTSQGAGILYLSQKSIRFVPDSGSGGFTARRADVRESKRNKMIGLGIRQKPLDLHPFHIRLANGQNYNFAPTSKSGEAERDLILTLLGER